MYFHHSSDQFLPLHNYTYDYNKLLNCGSFLNSMIGNLQNTQTSDIDSFPGNTVYPSSKVLSSDQLMFDKTIHCNYSNFMLPYLSNVPLLTPSIAMASNSPGCYRYFNSTQPFCCPNQFYVDLPTTISLSDKTSVILRMQSMRLNSANSSPVSSSSLSTDCSTTINSNTNTSKFLNNNEIYDNFLESNNKINCQAPKETKKQSKQFKCLECNKTFGHKHVLTNHKRVHTGEKPFSCLKCFKKFSRDHHLKTHMRLHTGERPFKCDVCPKKFVQVANLKRHLNVHSGPRPFSCEFSDCRYRFVSAVELNEHKKSHIFPDCSIQNKDEDIDVGIENNIIYHTAGSNSEIQLKVEEEPQDLSINKHKPPINIECFT